MGFLNLRYHYTQLMEERFLLIHNMHQTERIFDIADVPFSQVSDQEKREYEGKIIETGSYQGYKPRQFWVYVSLCCYCLL